MKTGNCRYENGAANSCFDCGCDECLEAVKQYEAWLNDKAKEDEYNSIVSTYAQCKQGDWHE